ncbi:MAG: tyrosine-type recombinase/integrase [Magnetospirillum sp.]|nr:tyrosine-type recombinase/integrase [Magnetospirillum sp.]
MARTLGRLTALSVARLKEPGYYPDGGCLYLQISASGTKSWLFIYSKNGRDREMGLGPLHTVSLAEARKKAEECRKLRLNGLDPIDMKRAEQLERKVETAKVMTFRECATAYIEAHEAGWRNAKHADQWRNTLAKYAYPAFGDLPVQAVDVGLVMKALEPIWASKTETASRLRGRIESILDWATVRGYRTGENPARWRGHLDNLLPKPGRVQRVRHHPALPYVEIATFTSLVRNQDGVAARALEFLILTAARTSEVIGATWDEIDLEAKLWVIPADRIKAGKEHRVPLSAASLAVLKKMSELRVDEHVFPGTKKGRPLSNMALLKLLARMERSDLTAHGFRSTFRDWAAERTNFPHEVAEMALAHAIGDKVEAAYRRGDLFEKRVRLMEAWARHCNTVKYEGTVVPLAERE